MEEDEDLFSGFNLGGEGGAEGKAVVVEVFVGGDSAGCFVMVDEGGVREELAEFGEDVGMVPGALVWELARRYMDGCFEEYLRGLGR